MPVGNAGMGLPHATARLASVHRSSQSAARRRVSTIGALPSALFVCFRDLLLDARAIDRLTVAGERALPRGNRIGVTVLLRAQIAKVVLDDGVLGKLLGCGRQGPIRQIELPLLDVGPPETVEERGV